MLPPRANSLRLKGAQSPKTILPCVTEKIPNPNARTRGARLYKMGAMSIALRAYSLGYEGMNLDSYIAVLQRNAISLVVDVRETPWSYKPGFSKKPLSERLELAGISYVHLKSAGNPSCESKSSFTLIATLRSQSP